MNAPQHVQDAQRLLAEIEEAHRRGTAQLQRIQAEGHDHFQTQAAKFVRRMGDGHLDHYSAHMVALDATQ